MTKNLPSSWQRQQAAPVSRLKLQLVRPCDVLVFNISLSSKLFKSCRRTLSRNQVLPGRAASSVVVAPGGSVAPHLHPPQPITSRRRKAAMIWSVSFKQSVRGFTAAKDTKHNNNTTTSVHACCVYGVTQIMFVCFIISYFVFLSCIS